MSSIKIGLAAGVAVMGLSARAADVAPLALNYDTPAAARNGALPYDLFRARIVPPEALTAETKAAERELVKHLKLIAGWERDGDGVQFVLGKPPDGEPAPAAFESCYAARDGRIYLWGDDSHPGGKQRHGTLFAVYGFLDEALGVKWVLPGDEGIVCPPRSTFSLPEGVRRHRTSLGMMTMRSGNPEAYLTGALTNRMFAPAELQFSHAEAAETLSAYKGWLLRMRHQRRDFYQYCHAFTKWRERFLPEHPEYFGYDPVYGAKRFGLRALENPRLYGQEKLCLSNPAVADQIIADWVAAGKPRFWNVCPNDGSPGFCQCENCLKLDEPRPGEKFNYHHADYNFSDRYLWFWNRIAERARKLRPDVTLVTYIYSFYRHAPRRERIACPDNFLAGVVPQLGDDYLRLWDEWRAVGLKRFFMRPNYLCYSSPFPRGIERFLYRNFHDGLRYGIVGVDYDGGETTPQLEFEHYVVGRQLSRPDLPFETIEAEFLSQYGAASNTVRRYVASVRERGERLLADDRFRGLSAKVLDDSLLGGATVNGYTREALESDLALMRSVDRNGLSRDEARRIDRLQVRIEHQLLTYDFFIAGAAKDAARLDAAGRRLYAFRLAHRRDLGVTAVTYYFYKTSGEFALWQKLPFFREIGGRIEGR